MPAARSLSARRWCCEPESWGESARGGAGAEFSYLAMKFWRLAGRGVVEANLAQRRQRRRLLAPPHGSASPFKDQRCVQQRPWCMVIFSFIVAAFARAGKPRIFAPRAEGGNSHDAMAAKTRPSFAASPYISPAKPMNRQDRTEPPRAERQTNRPQPETPPSSSAVNAQGVTSIIWRPPTPEKSGRRASSSRGSIVIILLVIGLSATFRKERTSLK